MFAHKAHFDKNNLTSRPFRLGHRLGCYQHRGAIFIYLPAL